MAVRSCDGAGFLAAFRSAVASLEANVDEINALNVFPVPDGDTGTNMLATVRAALEEADRAGPDADVERVAQAASYGALMGARGNSGVITSQILAGMAHGLAGKRRFNGLDLAHALDEGTKTAYKAVAKPVEGTILTVIREASAAAVAAAERDNNVETVLAATLEAAERAVAKTPSLLPILREAHVVDSGGQGLFRLFQGALDAARGRPVAAWRQGRGPAPPHGVPAPEPVAGAEEGEFGYETVYLLRARAGAPLDIPAIQAHLEAIGDSVLVAGDALLAKVHVHNERPDAVIAYGLSIGTLSRITDREPRQPGPRRPGDEGGRVRRLRGRRRADGPTAPIPTADVPATRLALGVVVVAPSDGLAAVMTDTAAPFREYGAFRVVQGGQSANPSTGELLEAVEATDADELLILSNNPNVVLAARQVAAMTERTIRVVPTRNCAEGVAALFELDPTQGAEANAATMTEAGRAIQTMQVTEAIRDATVSGRKVKKGQTIVLDPDDGLLAVDNDPQKAVLAGLGAARPGLRPADDLLRRDGDARRGRDAGAQGPRDRARRGRRGGPRRPAALPVPRLRRVSPAERRRSAPASGSRSLRPKVAAPAPATLAELLASPVGLSGIPQVAGLRRVARRMGVDTVRDLLFHLPRRYDDLRELRTLADLRDLDDGSVASARVTVTDISVQQTWRRRVQVTTARLTRRDRLRHASPGSDGGTSSAGSRPATRSSSRARSGTVTARSCSRGRSSSPSTPPTCSTSGGSSPSTG